VPPYALVLLIAGVTGTYSLVQIGRGLRARRWPVTEGEVTTASLSRYASTRGGTTDFESIAYRFEVDGLPYASRRLRFGFFGTSLVVDHPDPNYPRALGTFAEAYPRGSKVQVYYDPTDPHESVLYPMPPASAWLALVAAVVAAVATAARLV
jgi:hypothetical protein